jgi:hypothetical protein
MKGIDPRIKLCRRAELLTSALDFEFILKLENAAILRHSPYLCPFLLLLRQIIENHKAGPRHLLIGL